MNKSEMARKLATKASLTQARSADVLEAIFDPAHGVVAIGGFGTFESRERAARAGRNPRTGESITIAAKRYPAFKAAKSLKDRVS